MYRFLRQFVRDDEFEAQRGELFETRRVLAEYKAFIEKIVTKQRTKVDPDFLTLIWASVALAFSLMGSSIGVVSDLWENKNVNFWVWAVFGAYSFLFGIQGSIFALELTRKYAESKSDSGYLSYYFWLLIGVAILVIGLVVLVLFGQK